MADWQFDCSLERHQWHVVHQGAEPEPNQRCACGLFCWNSRADYFRTGNAARPSSAATIAAPSPADPLADQHVPRVSEHAARLREQMAAARMRCAVLHELDLNSYELPCAQCRQRGAEVYPLPTPAGDER